MFISVAMTTTDAADGRLLANTMTQCCQMERNLQNNRKILQTDLITKKKSVSLFHFERYSSRATHLADEFLPRVDIHTPIQGTTLHLFQELVLVGDDRMLQLPLPLIALGLLVPVGDPRHTALHFAGRVRDPEFFHVGGRRRVQDGLVQGPRAAECYFLHVLHLAHYHNTFDTVLCP